MLPVCLCLSVCLSVCLVLLGCGWQSACLSIYVCVCLCLSISVCMCMCCFVRTWMAIVWLSWMECASSVLPVCLSVCLSACLSVPVYLSICVSVLLGCSTCVSVCVYLSVSLCVCFVRTWMAIVWLSWMECGSSVSPVCRTIRPCLLLILTNVFVPTSSMNCRILCRCQSRSHCSIIRLHSEFRIYCLSSAV